MSIKIQSLQNYTESINALVYGDPGSGKTVLGGTAPNALILATEPGTVSAARQGSDADLAVCENYRDFADVLNALRRGNLDKKYEWVVVDTLTTLQQKMIQHITAEAHRENKNRSATIPDMLGHQEWQNLFKRTVQALNDLNENVLYLCHAMRAEDEDGDPMILPDIVGKNGTQDSTTMSRWVAGTVHLYGYLSVRKKKGEEKESLRSLIVERRGPYFGKDRYDLFGGRILKPNMAEISEKILGSSSSK